MKKILNRNNFQIFLVLLVALQPIVDMDYLIYGQLDALGLPRLSTVLHFVVFPLAIVAAFFLFDNKKKSTLIGVFSYLGVLGAYFVVHCMNVMNIWPELYLPYNFVFDYVDEFIYVFTMVIPYFLVYLFVKTDFTERQIKTTVVLSSALISIPIFLSNLFVFGKSTYVGDTQASILTWFTGIYEIHDPRTMASKFFFEEGNTIGIVLFMILPLMYYYFDQAKERKEKISIGTLIVIQSLSMIILSTKVATYGSIICAVVYLVIKFFCVFIMRNAKLYKSTLIFSAAVMLMCGAILPYCPAVVNMQIDRANDQVVLDDNYMIEQGKDGVGKDMQEAKTKWDPALVFQFEVYGIKSNLMSCIPKYYYLDWYPYKHDAYFWLDMLFNVPFYERVNGRQVQTLFIKYKWSETPNPAVDYALGLGYSNMMNGSLILEQDFVQQFYSFGYLGWPLIVGPWFVFLLYGVYKVLRYFKDNFREDILVFACSLCFGLVGAWMSGHTLDEYTSSVFMAFLIGVLLLKLKKAGESHES